MRKRILSFLTMLCMVTALLPMNMVTVSAYTGTKYGDDLYYRASNGKVTITDCISSATEVEIPAKINGYDVTSIGNEAFSYCTRLKSITIPNSVTSIGDNAFNFCSELKNIVIPDSVTLIGEYAFSGCGKLININIPCNVPQITTGMFTNCRNLYSIKIPNSVTCIGSHAFYNCNNLTSVTIPDSVTDIDNEAFRNCTNLKSITIPKGVTVINENAFSGCSNLTSITFSNLTHEICNYAFYNCSKLTDVVLPDGIANIGDYAFCGCTGLTDITIPDSVINIGSGAFNGCKNLENIKIPHNVTTISRRTFTGCTGLTNVTIHDNITSIGDYAFQNCVSLKNIYYNGTELNWNNIAVGSYNDEFINATHKNFAYVTIFDKIGNKIIDTTQNMGQTVDINNITVPKGYKLILYKDKEMQKEYVLNTPINGNLTLYAYFSEAIPKTQTTVSEDGKTFTIKPINIASGNTVILALYNGEEFVTMQSAVCSGTDIPFAVTDDYTTAKVMVWNNLDDITPICDVEIVK